MKDLSIVVPVYNVEKYLPKCLDSILETKWNNVSYEIIIIDDESPDGSLVIAKSYAEQYEVIQIISQENRGLGGARNTGIQNAQGTYIFFLDSDDFLIGDQMPEIINKARALDVDILEFSAQTVREDYSLIAEIFPVEDSIPVSGQEYYGYLHPSNSVCNKVYRRTFLQNNEILFIEKVYVEDAPFNLKSYLKASIVASYPLIPVAFLQNQSSITRQKRTGKQMVKFIEDSIMVTQYMSEYLSENLLSVTKGALERKLSVFVSGILLMIIHSEESWKKKKNYLDVLRGSDLYPMKFKSQIFVRDFFLLLVNIPALFYILSSIYNFFSNYHILKRN